MPSRILLSMLLIACVLTLLTGVAFAQGAGGAEATKPSSVSWTIARREATMRERSKPRPA